MKFWIFLKLFSIPLQFQRKYFFSLQFLRNFFLDRYWFIQIRETGFSVFRWEKSYFCSNFWGGVNFKALSKKYVNFNNFGFFFLKFVTKFHNFWKISLSFLVWETILTSKNLFWLEIFPLSYKERRIKKIEFQTNSTCKFASWTWQGKHKQSKFSANRLELARNTKHTIWMRVKNSFRLFVALCSSLF